MPEVKLRFADGHEETIPLDDPTAAMIVHECADGKVHYFEEIADTDEDGHDVYVEKKGAKQEPL
jgi:hypothetical protein